MRHRTSIPGVASAALILAGCTTSITEGPSPGVRVRDDRAPQAAVQYDTVVVIDKSLQDWNKPQYEPPWSLLFSTEGQRRSKITVEEARCTRTEGGQLDVWALFRNRTDYALQLEVRTSFFDRTRAPLEGPSAWTRLYLPPQGIDWYRTTSIHTSDVGHYYVEVREGR